MLLTLSNLFPRPDNPQRGLFNAQLFQEFERQLAGGNSEQCAVNSEQRAVGGAQATRPGQPLLNLCLVPEWRVWRWASIRRWTVPGQGVADDGSRLVAPRAFLPPTLYLPVFYLPRVGRDRAADGYYRSLRNLHVTVRGTRAVFATWLYPDGVAAARLARDLAVPCWIMVQGSDVFHLQHPRRLQALLDRIDDIEGFICVCQPLAEALLRAGLPRSRVHVVPNGVNPALFHYRAKTEAVGEGAGFRVQGSGGKGTGEHPEVRETEEWKAGRLEEHRRCGPVQSSVFRGEQGGLGCGAGDRPPGLLAFPDGFPIADVLGGQRKLVLFVGNLVPVKGPDVFLRSLALVKPAVGREPPVAVIIGQGPLRGELERMARRLGLGKAVHFLGSRSHDEVARWMNLADVLCLTSRSEGMPNVVIEALVSGVPVAVTDVGACRELVEGEPEARLCLREDAQALARSIRDLAYSPCDRPALAARHAARFSWTRQAGEILRLMGMGGEGGRKNG